MPLPNYSSRRAGLPIGTIVLLVAVFGWGLQYKTSLYQDLECNLHSKSLPPAKLLTEAERITASRRATTLAGATGMMTATVHLPAAGCEIQLAQCESDLPLAGRAPVAARRLFAKLFIRPPPLH